MKRGNPNLDRDRNTDTTAARKAKLRKAENFQLEIWKGLCYEVGTFIAQMIGGLSLNL